MTQKWYVQQQCHISEFEHTLKCFFSKPINEHQQILQWLTVQKKHKIHLYAFTDTTDTKVDGFSPQEPKLQEIGK